MSLQSSMDKGVTLHSIPAGRTVLLTVSGIRDIGDIEVASKPSSVVFGGITVAITPMDMCEAKSSLDIRADMP